MEFVEPIRDLDKIRIMKCLLIKQSVRDYLFFTLGINTGLRVNQMLEFKVKDIVGEDGNPREFIQVSPNKRGIYLNDSVRYAIRKFIERQRLSREDYLFASGQKGKPISRQHAYRIIKQVAAKVGLEDHIGTQTLRKTFGYHAFRQGVALSLLQERFHHVTPSETLKYIGIKKEEIVIPMIDVNL